MAKLIKSKVVKKKRKRPTSLSEEQWDDLRFQWCMKSPEEGYTIKDLAKKFGIAPITIAKRSSEHNWPAFKQELKLINIQNTSELITELGMSKPDLLRLIIEGAVKTEALFNIKKVAFVEAEELSKKTGNIKKTKKPVTVEETISVIDNNNTRIYRQELMKLFDLYPSPKVPIVSKINEENEQIPIVSYMQKEA